MVVAFFERDCQMLTPPWDWQDQLFSTRHAGRHHRYRRLVTVSAYSSTAAQRGAGTASHFIISCNAGFAMSDGSCTRFFWAKCWPWSFANSRRFSEWSFVFAPADVDEEMKTER